MLQLGYKQKRFLLNRFRNIQIKGGFIKTDVNTFKKLI